MRMAVQTSQSRMIVRGTAEGVRLRTRAPATPDLDLDLSSLPHQPTFLQCLLVMRNHYRMLRARGMPLQARQVSL